MDELADQILARIFVIGINIRSSLMPITKRIRFSTTLQDSTLNITCSYTSSYHYSTSIVGELGRSDYLQVMVDRRLHNNTILLAIASSLSPYQLQNNTANNHIIS